MKRFTEINFKLYKTCKSNSGKDWLKIIFQLWPEKNEGKKRARAGRERGSVEGRWRGEGMVPK